MFNDSRCCWSNEKWANNVCASDSRPMSSHLYVSRMYKHKVLMRLEYVKSSIFLGRQSFIEVCLPRISINLARRESLHAKWQPNENPVSCIPKRGNEQKWERFSEALQSLQREWAIRWEWERKRRGRDCCVWQLKAIFYSVRLENYTFDVKINEFVELTSDSVWHRNLVSFVIVSFFFHLVPWLVRYSLRVSLCLVVQTMGRKVVILQVNVFVPSSSFFVQYACMWMFAYYILVIFTIHST